jgi:hypothetical protein
MSWPVPPAPPKVPLTGQIEERWSQDTRHIRPQLGVVDFYRPSLPLER